MLLPILYGSISIVVIGLGGLLAVSSVKFVTRHKCYDYLQQLLIALAVGSLVGDAFMHLIPHALAEVFAEPEKEPLLCVNCSRVTGDSEEAEEEEEHGHSHGSGEAHRKAITICLVGALGIYLFLLLNRLSEFIHILRHQEKSSESEQHSHSHSEHEHQHDHGDTLAVERVELTSILLGNEGLTDAETRVHLLSETTHSDHNNETATTDTHTNPINNCSHRIPTIDNNINGLNCLSPESQNTSGKIDSTSYNERLGQMKNDIQAEITKVMHTADPPQGRKCSHPNCQSNADNQSEQVFSEGKRGSNSEAEVSTSCMPVSLAKGACGLGLGFGSNCAPYAHPAHAPHHPENPTSETLLGPGSSSNIMKLKKTITCTGTEDDTLCAAARAKRPSSKRAHSIIPAAVPMSASHDGLHVEYRKRKEKSEPKGPQYIPNTVEMNTKQNHNQGRLRAGSHPALSPFASGQCEIAIDNMNYSQNNAGHIASRGMPRRHFSNSDAHDEDTLFEEPETGPEMAHARAQSSSCMHGDLSEPQAKRIPNDPNKLEAGQLRTTALKSSAMQTEEERHEEHHFVDMLSTGHSQALRQSHHVHHHHTPEAATHGHSHGGALVDPSKASWSSLVWTVLIGDGIHNLCDGIAIGAQFSSSPIGGFMTAVAIFFHEIPHELGDFAMLIHCGVSIQMALISNMISTIISFIGMLIGVAMAQYSEFQLWLFMLTAGMFLYIALAAMLPELAQMSRLMPELLNVLPRRAARLSAFLLFAAQNLGVLLGYALLFAIAYFESIAGSTSAGKSEAKPSLEANFTTAMPADH